MQRTEKLRHIEALFYRGFDENSWFDTVLRAVTPESRVLDIGAGSGEGLQNHLTAKGRCAYAAGIDLDPRVVTNPHYDETRHMSAYDLPGAFEQPFDVIYSTMVAEHIDDPDRFIEAQLSVLAPGGVMVHHTVSRYFYTSLLNSLVSEDTKNALIARLGSGRKPADIFPAHYKLNSVEDLSALAKRHGLKLEIERYSSSPGYLRRSYTLMLLYVLIDKPLAALIPALRPGLIFTMRR